LLSFNESILEEVGPIVCLYVALFCAIVASSEEVKKEAGPNEEDKSRRTDVHVPRRNLGELVKLLTFTSNRNPKYLRCLDPPKKRLLLQEASK